jgi:hypothetical protein
MFRFGIKHIHKSAHDWYGNQGSEEVCNWQKLEIAQWKKIQKRISKCIAWIENSIIYGTGYISTLLDGMDDKVIRKKYLKRADKGVER